MSADEDEDEEDENLEFLLTPWKESTIFQEFSAWLISPDGKSKGKRQARQHVRQVEYVLQESSQRSFEMSYLFNRKAIRDNWLLYFEQRRKPGTLKSYIHSLRFFYKFVICDEPEHCTLFLSKCNAMIVIMDSWLSIYRKQVMESRWQKDLSQLTQLFKSHEIRDLDNSEYVQYCKRLINEINCGSKSPTFKEYVSVRDYILMYMCLDNASRTGALANMTCKEFDNAIYEDRTYKVAILDHKTLATSGPCMIVFTKDLFQAAQIYLNFFRNSMDGVNEKDRTAKFFLSWSGKRLSSSMVSAQLNSFWGKAVGHKQDRPRINATLVRKSVVSKVHKQEPGLKRDLANLMCHSETTAGRTYFLQEKTKKVGSTSTAVRNILREEEHEEAKKEDLIRKIFSEEIERKKITLAIVREKRNGNKELTEFSDLQLRDKIRYIIGATETKEDVDSEDGNVSDVDLFCEPKFKARRKERVQFLPSELKLIIQNYRALITGPRSQNITRKMFKDMLCDDMDELLKKYGEETLLAKVRTERKKYLSSEK